MNLYTKTHQFYCGIDLHARLMYVCIMNHSGEIVLHRNIPTSPEKFLSLLEPYLPDVVVAVECIFCWYWVADLCEKHSIAFVLGHALYMRLVHGAKVKNDKIDSQKIAALLYGKLLPTGYAYPHRMRATRDLLRRRMVVVRHRASLLTHTKETRMQYNLPEFERRIAAAANRVDLENLFPDPFVRLNVQTDLSLLSAYDKEIKRIEALVRVAATHHDKVSLELLQSIPGVGSVLSMVMLYEIHDIERFPDPAHFVSYARLVRCAHESGGKKTAGGGAKIGNVHLKWAFSEAACLLLRNSEEAKRMHQRLVSVYGRAKALTILSKKIGQAVFHTLKARTPFAPERFFHTPIREACTA